MRITLTTDMPALTKKSGDTFDYTDETKAKGLIAAGLAREAPPLAAGAVLDPATLAALAEMGAAIGKGITAAAPRTNAPEIGDSIRGVPTELKGLPIFGSAGGFLHAVKDIAAQYPEADTVKKMTDWREEQKKAGVFAQEHPESTKAPSGNFEGNDPDGGALIIPEFNQTIYERMQREINFLSDSDSMVIRGNAMTQPALDDSSRLNGFRYGGIVSAWANEADQMAQVSKVSFRTMDQRLKKLYVFAYVTDEQLADSPYALESYIAKYAAKEIVFRTNDVMFSGKGGGVPLGITKSPAKIAVSARQGQATKTILTGNIDDMWMNLNWACRADSVWYYNQDCEAALQAMALPIGIAGAPTYLPPGGVSGTPYASLKGRPAIPIEFCETLGTEGDLVLTSWSHYKTIVKGGVKSDMSMHLRFQYGEMAYRFTYRMDGEPAWDKPLTPFKGTLKTSSIITLATR